MNECSMVKGATILGHQIKSEPVQGTTTIKIITTGCVQSQDENKEIIQLPINFQDDPKENKLSGYANIIKFIIKSDKLIAAERLHTMRPRGRRDESLISNI